MIHIRATKYAPANRDSQGRYLVDEWTSIDDIGKKFRGQAFTEREYLSTEDNYIFALKQFLAFAKVDTLRLVDLEARRDAREAPVHSTLSLQDAIKDITEGALVCNDAIETVSRMVLREIIWCRLHGEKGTYVHFGYDYYMYFGTDLEGTAPIIPPKGMYYDSIKSPYAIV